MSFLKIINVVFLQWFFVRLTKCREIIGQRQYRYFSIMYWVIPCTGWWSIFKFIGGPEGKIKRVSEKRLI